MDILDTIKTARDLISNEKTSDLLEPLDVLTRYVYSNMSKLNEDRQLRQKAADCFELGGKQLLANLPDRYIAHGILAMASFLNGDVRGMCRSMTAFFDADSKDGGAPLSSDETWLYFSFYCDNLPDKDVIVFGDSVSAAICKAYPGSAAAVYVKALGETDRERMMDYLSETLAIDKDFTLALLTLATAFQEDRNWKAAISYYNKSIVLCDSDASVYFDLAICYGQINDYENEIKAYHKCLEFDPKYEFALNNLGYAYEKNKEYEQALSCYHKAIQSGCNQTYPYRNTFRLLKKLRRYDEAIAFWEANKNRLPQSCQKDADKLREYIHGGTTKMPQTSDDEAETISKHTRKKSVSETLKNHFMTEMRLEEEIEERMNRGLPFFDELPLKVYESSDAYGRQFVIPGVGRIDILAVNADTGDFYVIELKRGAGEDEVVGQVSRYMGWVKRNLAPDGKKVYGIICTGQASERLRYAAEANPNIRLYNYGIQVTPLNGVDA